MNLPSINDIDVQGKRVFVRADLDVPLTQQTTDNSKQQTAVADDTRLLAALPTIEFLLHNEATVIIGGKLGRPNGVDKSLSMEPVAKWLFDQFKVQLHEHTMRSTRIGNFDGWELDEKIFVLENLRFYKGEEENDPAFAKELASVADIYVNDSFAVSHRKHASIAGVPKLLPHYAGFRLQKEVEVLSSVLNSPKRPLVVIIGGAKIETKLPLIEKMKGFADYVLVGGKLPMEFKVQSSKFKVEEDERLVIADLTVDGTDILQESVEKFKAVINKAAMIVWNGPLGLIEAGPAARHPHPMSSVANRSLRALDGVPPLASPASSGVDSERGTREVAKAVVESSAYKIVGGGDTIDYLQKQGMIDKFDFVSMGGGAMLSFLSGEKLPGLEALVR